MQELKRTRGGGSGTGRRAPSIAGLTCFLVALTLGPTTTSAEDLNIDLGGTFGGPPPTDGAASGQTGPWNVVTSPTAPFSGVVDVTGAPTGVTIVPFFDVELGAGSPSAMMSDGFVGVSGFYGLTLSGLADGTYDVYLYDNNDFASPTGSGDVNGVPFGDINGGFTGSYVLGSNYHLLTGVVVTGGGMDVFGVGTLGAPSAGLAGMQVIETGCPDMTNPTATCAIARPLLFPPFRGLLPVGLTVSVTDDDPLVTSEVTIYSNEDPGTTPFAPDAVDMGGWRFRAERDVSGDGRIYLAVVEGEDSCGNQGFACCTSVVPKFPTLFHITALLMEAAAAQSVCDGTSAPFTPGTIPTGFMEVSP